MKYISIISALGMVEAVKVQTKYGGYGGYGGGYDMY